MPGIKISDYFKANIFETTSKIAKLHLIDKASFEKIFREMYRPLCGFVAGINENKIEAENIVLEVSIKY